MEFTYVIREDSGQQYLEITGCKSSAASIRVPMAIDGVPVQAIGPHAFEKMEEVRQVQLPDSVKSIGAFAFYGCRNLSTISLSDNAASWGTGALYFCGNLSEIRLKVTQRKYSILRDMLADTDLGIYVRILDESPGRICANGREALPSVLSGRGAGEFASGRAMDDSENAALLYFPAYTHGFDEDTYARAFHTWIEGCGFAYRETVMRTGIDYREYDLLFGRAEADGVGGVQTAANVALSRLMYPCSLRESARKKYAAYLAEHGEEVLMRLVGDHDRERTMFLLEEGYVSPEAAGRAVLKASEQGDAELVGMLMRLRGETGSRGEDEFDLGEL
ncbi:MAG: leucine-rich repeat domain-containing protein [Lachnospiraceae bacterium]|nr:leucine-rich repeat domain-containing protein [Lachnospiraceae bacterium]